MKPASLSSRQPPRIEWGDRQLVAGRDLRAAMAFLDAQRARHLRGAHRTWGVAIGLRVWIALTVSPRTARVEPGLAYDPSCRELLLTGPVEVAIPDEATGAVLVVLGGCDSVPGASVRVTTGRAPLRPRHEVPLAVVDLDAGTIDQRVRPQVRTMAPPHLAGAHVQVGAAAAEGSTFGYRVAVDTSIGGFDEPPRYLVQPYLGSGAPVLPAGVIGPLCEVTDPGPQGFSLVVRYAAATTAAAAQLTRQVRANPFAFDWLGVQPYRPAGIGAVPGLVT